VDSENLFQETKDALQARGVDLEKLADIVLLMQQRHSPELTKKQALENILGVLKKREVQHAVLTGVMIDEVVENKKTNNPIKKLVEEDDGLYGVDETLALSIVNCYGSIAASNFGYLDIIKPGIIKDFDTDGKQVHTFLDDILCAIAAAACSRYAHNK